MVALGESTVMNNFSKNGERFALWEWKHFLKIAAFTIFIDHEYLLLPHKKLLESNNVGMA